MEEIPQKLQDQIGKFIDDRLSTAQPQVYQNAIIAGQVKPRHLVAGSNPEGTLYQSDGTNFAPITLGANGQILTVANDLPSWQTYTPPASTTVIRQEADGSNATLGTTTRIIGWGFTPGAGGNGMTEIISFGVTFSTAPITGGGFIGYKDSSDPTSVTDCSPVSDFGVSLLMSAVRPLSTTQAQFAIAAMATMSATRRFLYTWWAEGVLA